MTTITIRAADSAEALQEVLRRLGPDAMILSTRQNRGLVEVQATTAQPKPDLTRSTTDPRPPSPPPRNPPADLPADPPATVTFSFRAHLDQATRQTAAAADADTALLPPALSGRVILTGPPGAGCSLLAARLAAAALRATDSAAPVLIAPRRDPLAAAGNLAGWARLMGLTPHRPVWAMDSPPNLPLPDADRLEILDLSALPMPAPEQVKTWASLPDTQIWLVLPSGLHPDLHARLCPPLQGMARLIVLTRTDLCPPTPDDLSLATRFGIPVGLLAQGTGLLNALSPAPLARFPHRASPQSAPCANSPAQPLQPPQADQPPDAAACVMQPVTIATMPRRFHPFPRQS